MRVVADAGDYLPAGRADWDVGVAGEVPVPVGLAQLGRIGASAPGLPTESQPRLVPNLALDLVRTHWPNCQRSGSSAGASGLASRVRAVRRSLTWSA